MRLMHDVRRQVPGWLAPLAAILHLPDTALVDDSSRW